MHKQLRNSKQWNPSTTKQKRYPRILDRTIHVRHPVLCKSYCFFSLKKNVGSILYMSPCLHLLAQAPASGPFEWPFGQLTDCSARWLRMILLELGVAFFEKRPKTVLYCCLRTFVESVAIYCGRFCLFPRTFGKLWSWKWKALSSIVLRNVTKWGQVSSRQMVRRASCQSRPTETGIAYFGRFAQCVYGEKDHAALRAETMEELRKNKQ